MAVRQQDTIQEQQGAGRNQSQISQQDAYRALFLFEDSPHGGKEQSGGESIGSQNQDKQP